MTETEYKLDNNEPEAQPWLDILRPMKGHDKICDMLEEMAGYCDVGDLFSIAKDFRKMFEDCHDFKAISIDETELIVSCKLLDIDGIMAIDGNGLLTSIKHIESKKRSIHITFLL